MSAFIACPRCGSGNATTMARCWVCGAAIAGAPPPATPPPARDDTIAFRAIGWLALLAGLLFVGGLVAIELALEWPGLLVPYALVQLVVFAALARTAWVNLRRPPAPATTADGPPSGAAGASPGISANEVVQGVAIALTMAIAVIALLALLAVAAIILFMMVCFGVIAVSGS